MGRVQGDPEMKLSSLYSRLKFVYLAISDVIP